VTVLNFDGGSFTFLSRSVRQAEEENNIEGRLVVSIRNTIPGLIHVALCHVVLENVIC